MPPAAPQGLEQRVTALELRMIAVNQELAALTAELDATNAAAVEAELLFARLMTHIEQARDVLYGVMVRDDAT